MGPQRAQFSDGRRHFQHGPIDLIVDAEGEPEAVAAAHEDAWARFVPLLGELVEELPALRQPVRGERAWSRATARRMWEACAPYGDRFITPMAAVAGAVADEVIASYRVEGVRRAYVNNGGDVALHLEAGERFEVGVFADLARLDAAELEAGEAPLAARVAVDHAMPVRGLATSGWRGRSFSLGVADAVTVLAATAAQADAAATRVANAVNVDHPAVRRAPACTVKDDSDLGDLLVTRDVPPLPASEVARAVEAGLAEARMLQQAGLIHSAFIACQSVRAAVEPRA
jgi:hypothetical protein